MSKPLRFGPSGTVGPAPGFTWAMVRCTDGWLPGHGTAARANCVTSAKHLNELRAIIARAEQVPASRVRIHINSWARTDAYNSRIGGERHSYHTPSGRKPCAAVDVRVFVSRRVKLKLIETQITPKTVAWYAAQLPAYGTGGIGTYSSAKNFTHVDHRGYTSRWSG